MGLRDFLRRRKADTENQGDDFIDDDFLVSSDQCENPKEVTEDATDAKAE